MNRRSVLRLDAATPAGFIGCGLAPIPSRAEIEADPAVQAFEDFQAIRREGQPHRDRYAESEPGEAGDFERWTAVADAAEREDAALARRAEATATTTEGLRVQLLAALWMLTGGTADDGAGGIEADPAAYRLGHYGPAKADLDGAMLRAVHRGLTGGVS
ncbi:MAG: hypothetical protein ACFBWO_07725 [Paracoccaceae bacterium]